MLILGIMLDFTGKEKQMRYYWQMVGEAPHVKLQLGVEVWTTPNILPFFRQNVAKIAPTLSVEYHLLRGFEHSPAHWATESLICALLLKETNGVGICPLLIGLGLWIEIVHNRGLLLTVVVERLGYVHHPLSEVAETHHKVEILAIGYFPWAVEIMVGIEAALGY